MVDLHTHSTASDGTFTPAELAAAVKKAGISAFALTDHDILSGLDEAAAEAKRQGIIFIVPRQFFFFDRFDVKGACNI